MSMKSQMRAIFLNGPPSSGKDLAAIILRNMLDNKRPKLPATIPFRVDLMKFADPLKQAVHALYGVPYSCEYYEKEFGNEWKDKPQVEFYGNKPRDEYIALSEEFAKVRHGSSIFGRIAARRCQLSKQQNTFIFSDSGFVEEAIPVISYVGLENALVIELERPGTNFNHDSRGYVGDTLNSHFAGKLNIVRIHNNQDQAWLTLLLKGAMMKYYGYEAEF